MDQYRQLAHQLGERRLNNALLISRKDGYAYMSNPKAGCSTIKLYLARAETGDAELSPPTVHQRQYLPHIKPSGLTAEERTGLFTGQFFVFSFVRHPFSRVVSAYEDKIRGNRPQKAEILAALGRDPENLKEPVSFDEFVTVITRQNPNSLNPHWRPQTLNLAPAVLPYSFLGRLESFDDDLALVRDRLQLPVFQVAAQNRKGATRPKKLALTRWQRLALSDLYCHDFRTFGYTMNGLERLGATRNRIRKALRKARRP